jgi:hypothetical protein
MQKYCIKFEQVNCFSFILHVSANLYFSGAKLVELLKFSLPKSQLLIFLPTWSKYQIIFVFIFDRPNQIISNKIRKLSNQITMA